VGKALLAYAEPDVVGGVLSRPLRRLTGHSITDPAKLAEELAEIRRAGLAYDREEAALGVGCIAAPVLVRGKAVAALSLTLPAERIGAAGPANAIRVISLTLARTLAGRGAG
jgi:DNA-binding IclR family transcriptional regulator